MGKCPFHANSTGAAQRGERGAAQQLRDVAGQQRRRQQCERFLELSDLKLSAGLSLGGYFLLPLDKCFLQSDTRILAGHTRAIRPLNPFSVVWLLTATAA